MEVTNVTNKKKGNKLDREEYGHGFDLSPDDFDVIGQNQQAKKQNKNENKGKPDSKNNPSILNQ